MKDKVINSIEPPARPEYYNLKMWLCNKQKYLHVKNQLEKLKWINGVEE